MATFSVIVNPTAGKGAGRRQTETVRDLLHAHRLDFDLFLTEAPGHAIELACEASLSGCAAVVAIGGDGTANEVLNGLMRAKERGGRAALGMIGVGTGNDFAYAAGIPEGIEAACRCLVQGRRRPIDVGRVAGGDWPEGRYFCNGVGVGFDVTATIETKKLKHLTGTPAFLLGALKTLFLYFDAPSIVVQADGRTVEAHYLMISAMNGRRFGGGFYVAPEAEPDDGQFDLVLAEQSTRLTALHLIGRYMKGTQLTHRAVSSLRARRITIDASGGLNSHADGEIYCIDGRHIELEMLPRQIEVICETGSSNRISS
ncbi:MAG: diacylglycerol kinase family lipid kinase [Anaerolineae bacterium]|nr:diacylglycerol kinase family lipid kinase [Anaerolineae bacterium]